MWVGVMQDGEGVEWWYSRYISIHMEVRGMQCKAPTGSVSIQWPSLNNQIGAPTQPRPRNTKINHTTHYT
jgi:hypothetical protein